MPTIEEQLVDLAKRALADPRIVGVGIAIAYAEGPPAGIVLAPEHLTALLAAVARLEHRVQVELDRRERAP